MWVSNLIHEIGFEYHKFVHLCCDNLSALYMSISHVFHARIKHIELDYQYVGEKVADGIVQSRFNLYIW